MSQANKIYAVLAEFKDPAALLAAARELRDKGYKRFDCHSPFPIHGMDDAMGLGNSIIGWLTGIAGFSGAAFAMGMQWWMSAVDYKIMISGKPLFSYQAFVPITFELGVLAAAITAFVSMLAINKLPMLYHQLFNARSIPKISDDGFFVSVEAADPLFSKDNTARFLKTIGAVDIETVEAS